MHELLMQAGILAGLEAMLSDPALTDESLYLLSLIVANMAKQRPSLEHMVRTALEYPVQGLLKRLSLSSDSKTQMNCLEAMESMVASDLAVVGQACEIAASNLVHARTGIDPTGARWSQTILARAKVLVEAITAHFTEELSRLTEQKASGDIAAIFHYLTHPGRRLRMTALRLLVADARAITGPGPLQREAPRQLSCWRLVIVGASGLPRADGPFAKSDPYTSVLWNGQLLGQTEIKLQTLEPSWNEDFLLRLPPDQGSGDLHLKVFDYDRLSDHDFMADLQLAVGDSEVPQRRGLRVEVVGARDLPRMDLTGANDPYAVVSVAEESQQTATIDGGGASPEWNENLEWELLVSGVPPLTVSVFDEDVGSSDDLIGDATLEMFRDHAPDEAWEIDEWVPLERKGKQRGAVQLRISWDPEPSAPQGAGFVPGGGAEYKLSATVLQCEGLKKADRFGQNDVYVSLSAVGQKRKTSTIDGGGAAPVWAEGGETVQWDLRSPPKEVEVAAWDEDVGSADDMLGRCAIPIAQHLSDGPWTQEAWHDLADAKGRAAGRAQLRLSWELIPLADDTTAAYTMKRTLLDERGKPAGTIELRLEKLADTVPEEPPPDVVREAELRSEVEDGNNVLNEDYIAALNLVGLLCRLKSIDTAERQDLALELLEAVRARCIADHSTLPIERAHLVDTIASAAHSLGMVAEEGVKVKVLRSSTAGKQRLHSAAASHSAI